MAANVSEKDINDGIAISDVDLQVPSTPDSGLEWTYTEEKKLIRKIDFVLMPLLILGFFALQLDRSNIGNAFTDFFLQEVGITQFQFNIGNQLMYLGIVLFEIPSNLVLYRVGPAIWIGFQVAAWGLVATFQAFIKGQGPGAYYATRFLLGVCECGYIPASLFTITRFYKAEETSKRFAWFFLGNIIANGSAGLLAYGILHMRGIGGLSGWQWLFILEGLFTLLVAGAFIAFFPTSLSQPVSLFGLHYFNEREAEVLVARVIRDDPLKIHKKPYVSREELIAALTNWRLLAHIVLMICTLSAQSGLYAFGPSIVASYGYGRLRSNAMVTIGFWMLILTTLAWGWAADKWGKRGPLVFLGTFISCCLLVTNRLLVSSDNHQAKFAVLTLMGCFSIPWHPVHGSWLALNAKSAGERSITLAIFIMAANTSGIVGGQIFQARDAPRYQTAWSVTVALACTGAAATVLANLQYWILNRRIARKGVGNDGWVYKI